MGRDGPHTRPSRRYRCKPAASGWCSRPNTSVLKVISNDQYWLPFGWVQAYAIENNISDPDGAPLYSITKYWSPALGFLIGQRTVVTKGPWPQEVAPDWQLVAIDPPAP
jgi:hypothetical protein